MAQIRRILNLLADGQFHSGEQLGAALGVSRSAVWQTLKRLLDPTLELHAVRGRGYRIAGGLELLDANSIVTAINDPALAKQIALEIHDTIDSTNSYVLSKINNPPGLVCVAEQQTAGRGRRGRTWFSSFGKNIALSMLWHFPGGSTTLAGLSLVIGIAVVNALNNYGIHDVALKWPNDVIYHQHKLGGILIEIAGDAGGPCQVVIGIGLNVAITSVAENAINQAWTDVHTITGKNPQRNRLIGLLLRELLLILPQFQTHGLAAFANRWQQLDVLYDRPIVLETGGKQIHGIAAGIDSVGNLLVNNNGELQRFHSGEVSVRLGSK